MSSSRRRPGSRPVQRYFISHFWTPAFAGVTLRYVLLNYKLKLLMNNSLLILPSAVLLDLIFGDPHRLPHPVRWIGRIIILAEKKYYPRKRGKRSEFIGGCCTVTAVTSIVGGTVWLLLSATAEINAIAVSVFSIIGAYYTLATRSLITESTKVKRHLVAGNLPEARREVAMIVGRDTETLDEKGVARAAIEAVAESITDGIVSPLFYLALGGPVAAMMFKAVSTMDSMIGHRDERYNAFGTCAARLDDILNFIPARITAFVLLPLASLILGLQWKNAFRTVIRDRLKHQSPNSAHGEAAVAGALGIQLGGGAFYDGEFISRPFLGEPHNGISPALISRVNALAVAAMLIMTLFIMGAKVIFTVV